jgi:Type I phosphodiesterase / nucleotide pyrophosphatase
MAMAREPRTSPIVPSYGESSLAELSTSILASLTGDDAANGLNLPEADRVGLLVIDGLGLELLRANQAAAPFLAELAFNSRPLTAGFPSTTVTSLTSIGTGLVPAVHGMLGYQVAIGGTGRLLNGLHWPDDIDPAAWQPQPTIFERALAAGITPVHIAPAAYAKSGLTRAALRGAEYRAADSLGTLAALTAAALAESDRTFVAAYHGDLDAAGHRYGVSSPAWTFQLAHVDRLAEQLASSLPYGSVLYVTADHGMVNVGSDDRIDVDGAASALRDGVALLGGEPRARHVYTRPGAAADVLAAWREVLGEHAWVVSREEAIKHGWFGPPGVGAPDGPDEAMAARIGDVVAACAGTSAIIASTAEPRESSLIGMHGSLTQDEQLVPMLASSARLTRGARSSDLDGSVSSWVKSWAALSRPRYPRPSA